MGSPSRSSPARNLPEEQRGTQIKPWLEARAKGNTIFSSGGSAVNHFTEAINLAPTNHVLYSNCSAALASLHHYDETPSDTKKTVKLKPE
ncbi:hypothetical protein YC2023_051629 [Brassica napus]